MKQRSEGYLTRITRSVTGLWFSGRFLLQIWAAISVSVGNSLKSHMKGFIPLLWTHTLKFARVFKILFIFKSTSVCVWQNGTWYPVIIDILLQNKCFWISNTLFLLSETLSGIPPIQETFIVHWLMFYSLLKTCVPKCVSFNLAVQIKAF